MSFVESEDKFCFRLEAEFDGPGLPDSVPIMVRSRDNMVRKDERERIWAVLKARCIIGSISEEWLDANKNAFLAGELDSIENTDPI